MLAAEWATFIGRAGLVLCALACLSPAMYGQRMSIAWHDAWADRSTEIAIGKITRVTPPAPPAPKIQTLPSGVVTESIEIGGGGTAYYDFEVSEWFKPSGAGLPPRITIAESWLAFDTADLKPGVDVVLFVRKQGEYYQSIREIYLDSPSGQATLRGARLFFRLMNAADALRRQDACLAAWNADLSDPEKHAVLDAMRETRTPRYSEALLRIARGGESTGFRPAAISILAEIGNAQGVKELVPMLSSDPDCQIKRGLVALFWTYKVREALPAIDELLGSDQTAQCTGWPANDLLETARKARAAIMAASPNR
jgi:hypothetical protein